MSAFADIFIVKFLGIHFSIEYLCSVPENIKNNHNVNNLSYTHVSTMKPTYSPIKLQLLSI